MRGRDEVADFLFRHVVKEVLPILKARVDHDEIGAAVLGDFNEGLRIEAIETPVIGITGCDDDDLRIIVATRTGDGANYVGGFRVRLRAMETCFDVSRAGIPGTDRGVRGGAWLVG